MVVRNGDDDDTDRLFRALSDRTRRDILTRVLREDHSVSQLAATYDMSFAAVQKHVAVLEDARLVTKRRVGRQQLVSGDVSAASVVRDVLDGYDALWRARADRMSAILAEQEKGMNT
jgi:DNA-binding transcriptional ArsR family regulator